MTSGFRSYTLTKKLICDEMGSALVEAAVAIPIMATLIVGIVILAQYVVQSQQISGTVQGGVLYVTANGWCLSAPCTSTSTTSTGISNAVSNVGITGSVTATTSSGSPACFWGCPSGAGVNTYTENSATLDCYHTPANTCAGTTYHPGQYVLLDYSKPWTAPLIGTALLSGVSTTRSKAVVRIQ